MAGQTPAEYISHHIQNLTYGVKDSGELGFAGSAAEAKNMGFMALNVDTMFWSVSCGILLLVLQMDCRKSLNFFAEQDPIVRRINSRNGLG